MNVINSSSTRNIASDGFHGKLLSRRRYVGHINVGHHQVNSCRRKDAIRKKLEYWQNSVDSNLRLIAPSYLLRVASDNLPLKQKLPIPNKSKSYDEYEADLNNGNISSTAAVSVIVPSVRPKTMATTGISTTSSYSKLNLKNVKRNDIAADKNTFSAREIEPIGSNIENDYDHDHSNNDDIDNIAKEEGEEEEENQQQLADNNISDDKTVKERKKSSSTLKFLSFDSILNASKMFGDANDEMYMLEAITVVDLSHSKYSASDQTGFESLTGLLLLNINNNNLNLNDVDTLPALRELNLACNRISQLPQLQPRKSFLNLEVLDLSFNYLSNPLDLLPLLEITMLKILDLSGNGLIGFPKGFQTMRYLKQLNLSDNNLNDPPLIANEKDNEDNGDNNWLRNVGLLPKLTDLDISNNKISFIPFLNHTHRHHHFHHQLHHQVQDDGESDKNDKEEEKDTFTVPIISQEGTKLLFPKLLFLNISNNLIQKEKDIIAISSFPQLRELFLWSNPLVAKTNGVKPQLMLIRKALVDQRRMYVFTEEPQRLTGNEKLPITYSDMMYVPDNEEEEPSRTRTEYNSRLDANGNIVKGEPANFKRRLRRGRGGGKGRRGESNIEFVYDDQNHNSTSYHFQDIDTYGRTNHDSSKSKRSENDIRSDNVSFFITQDPKQMPDQLPGITQSTFYQSRHQSQFASPLQGSQDALESINKGRNYRKSSDSYDNNSLRGKNNNLKSYNNKNSGELDSLVALEAEREAMITLIAGQQQLQQQEQQVQNQNQLLLFRRKLSEEGIDSSAFSPFTSVLPNQIQGEKDSYSSTKPNLNKSNSNNSEENFIQRLDAMLSSETMSRSHIGLPKADNNMKVAIAALEAALKHPTIADERIEMESAGFCQTTIATESRRRGNMQFLRRLKENKNYLNNSRSRNNNNKDDINKKVPVSTATTATTTATTAMETIPKKEERDVSSSASFVVDELVTDMKDRLKVVEQNLSVVLKTEEKLKALPLNTQLLEQAQLEYEKHCYNQDKNGFNGDEDIVDNDSY